MFYDITNKNKRSPYNQGGAMYFSHTTLQHCEFKRNKCDGGAVAFNIEHNSTISDCTFEDNYAGHKGGAIYIKSEIEEPDGNSDTPNFDGVNTISIINCLFKGNDAQDEHAISINQYYSHNNTKLIVTGCIFTNNGNATDSYMIYANISEIDFETNIVKYTDTSKSSGIFSLFNDNLKSMKIVNCDFTNCHCNQEYSIIVETISNNSLLSILGCNFSNCKSLHFFIKYDGGDAEVDSCTFQFDNSSSACGILHFSCFGFKLQNSNFVKTNSTGAVSFFQRYSDEI